MWTGGIWETGGWGRGGGEPRVGGRGVLLVDDGRRSEKKVGRRRGESGEVVAGKGRGRVKEVASQWGVVEYEMVSVVTRRGRK